MANLLFNEVFSKVGFPRSIVSDRGSLFILAWWSTFCYEFTVKRRLSNALSTGVFHDYPTRNAGP
jgi:hypothetical protein